MSVAIIVKTISARTASLKKGTKEASPVKEYVAMTEGATISKTITKIIINWAKVRGKPIFFANLPVDCAK